MNASQGHLPGKSVQVVGLIAATLAASVTGVFLISKFSAPFELPMEFQELPMSPSDAYMARYKVAFRQMLCGNYAIHFAICGALLGLALGKLGAVNNKSTSAVAAMAGGLVGGLLLGTIGGILLGILSAWGLDINWETMRLIGFQIDPFIQTTLLLCFVWMCIGIGIGIGSTIHTKSVSRMKDGLFGGMLGGAIAGLVYSLIAAVMFSTSSATDFVPKYSTEQFVWAITGGLSTFAGLYLWLSSRSNSVPESPPSIA